MTRRADLVLPALLALAGCAQVRWMSPPAATTVAHRPAAPNLDGAPVQPTALVTAEYRIACPDVLEVRFCERPEYDCLASVGVDGSIGIGPRTTVTVAGKTATEARLAVAAAFGVDPAGVSLTVADPRAGMVELYGPESNRHRTVAYRGPETVLEFLLRTGALKRGCFDPRDVTVLRPNVAAGTPAQVFHVDLTAILLDGDGRTNLPVAPGDQVYVGESRRSSFARLLPKRLVPAYQRLVGIVPDGWPWVRLGRPPTPLFPAER